MIRALADESVLLGSLVSALCVALDLPEKWMNVALAAVPLALALLVRSIVTKPSTLAQVASDASLETAQQLGTGTVGAVGETTERGLTVVDNITDRVLDTVGGLAGALSRRTNAH